MATLDGLQVLDCQCNEVMKWTGNELSLDPVWGLMRADQVGFEEIGLGWGWAG